ncbi:MAG: thymidine phosphorylase [Gemmatimonadales bacterium]|nr:thymidine phosphorylase [Gemmatimonadales bacterium]NIN13064.1 thymidine phosphorylase [Gemmatimonadales bacterium]NIN51148.1 thymidine phosphorylase [Gemmatimonadales bacterium]NIP08612.1 thymidine phosphorylase [Gemmatimonadales bacterium]NIR02300.1 thymidine phosphorylase [Gemmatimonadales bacterium]
MIVIPLIERKRDGGRLTREEWSQLVVEYAAGRVPDYQMAALLMAVLLNGLDDAELGGLTDAMRGSGACLEYDPATVPRVDKHSTGGVGDKVSLVLAPLVASVGVAVPMISGRGLAHTGGTLDKLESIPGFRTDLALHEVRRQVERIGAALIGQTSEIAPADRKLYALRDATATVEAIPLMAASIMSKKLAEGLNGLVLDIKRGSGAFLPHVKDGLELAQTMIGLGEERGCRTVALVTAMDRPLGRACGNALEVEEAVAALQGEGPPDLMEVVYALGTEMLLLAGVEDDVKRAGRTLQEAITCGKAVEKFREIIEAQGGNPDVLDDLAVLPHAPSVGVYEAPAAGYVDRVEPRVIGQGVANLGGGRQHMDDGIDHSVGFVITVKPGDRVARGQPLASIYAREPADVRMGRDALDRAIRIVHDPAEGGLPLVSHRVTAKAVEILG